METDDAFKDFEIRSFIDGVFIIDRHVRGDDDVLVFAREFRQILAVGVLRLSEFQGIEILVVRAAELEGEVREADFARSHPHAEADAIEGGEAAIPRGLVDGGVRGRGEISVRGINEDAEGRSVDLGSDAVGGFAREIVVHQIEFVVIGAFDGAFGEILGVGSLVLDRIFDGRARRRFGRGFDRFRRRGGLDRGGWGLDRFGFRRSRTAASGQQASRREYEEDNISFFHGYLPFVMLIFIWFRRHSLRIAGRHILRRYRWNG